MGCKQNLQDNNITQHNIFTICYHAKNEHNFMCALQCTVMLYIGGLPRKENTLTCPTVRKSPEGRQDKTSTDSISHIIVTEIKIKILLACIIYIYICQIGNIIKFLNLYMKYTQIIIMYVM